MTKTTNRSQFNAMVMKAIDEGVDILGDSPVKQAFYYHVEKRLKITRETIPDNLHAFHEALFELFDQGGVILERRIARILYDKFGVEFVAHNGWSLLDYIQHAELQSIR